MSDWADGSLTRLKRLRELDLRELTLATVAAAPAVYERVLALLRRADTDGSWPQTSRGRMQVIRDAGADACGSFSGGAMPGNLPQPAANESHPELVHAIFALEQTIAPHRLGSSTVAINRRALFKPHTDSGAGAGQCRSLIVALGNFTGGELIVEGEVHDVRYSPLEFDGWACRHWTAPFVGERFSLVWFTPLGCEDAGWLRRHAIGTTAA